MMKKVLMLLIGAALILSMAGAVAAEDATPQNIYNGTTFGATEDNDKGNETLVQLIVDNDYVVFIPNKVTLSSKLGEETTGNVSVKDIRIGVNQTLNVSVESTNGWKVKWDADSAFSAIELPYSVNATYYITDTEKKFKRWWVSEESGNVTFSGTDNVNTGHKGSAAVIHLANATAENGKVKFLDWYNTTMYFTLIEEPEASGVYNDTLKFTVSIDTNPVTWKVESQSST